VPSHAYNDAMARINEQDPSCRDLAYQVLSWITCAKRPVTAAELQYALTVEGGDSELDEDDLLQVDEMIVVCAGLVTIDVETAIIRLVHFTTQEYFQQTKKKWLSNAEKEILAVCITYLSFSEFETGACDTDDEFEQRLQNSPLYDYTARNWGHHARQAAMSSLEMVQFLSSPALVEASSQAPLVAKRWYRHSNYSQEFPRQMTGLHVAAYFGVEEAVAELLKAAANANAKTNDGSTPLHRASRNGHDTVVQQLLGAGADANAKTNDGSTPLHDASENGHDTVVQHLLRAGADANAKTNSSSTPLHVTPRNGHDTMVQQLLEAGADANAKTNYGSTPLYWASENGHDTAVQKLLGAGIDANAKANSGWTPLHVASENGHDTVVQKLLGAGADANAVTEDGWAPLHEASENGHDTVVQKLLTAGADANAKTNSGSTPLHVASRNDHDTVV